MGFASSTQVSVALFSKENYSLLVFLHLMSFFKSHGAFSHEKLQHRSDRSRVVHQVVHQERSFACRHGGHSVEKTILEDGGAHSQFKQT